MPVLEWYAVLASFRNPKRASVRNMSESDGESALNNNGVSMCGVQVCLCGCEVQSAVRGFLSCVI